MDASLKDASVSDFLPRQGSSPVLGESKEEDESLYGHSARDAAQLNRLRRSLAQMKPNDRKTLLSFAGKVIARKRRK
jgi:hypothetical protein